MKGPECLTSGSEVYYSRVMSNWNQGMKCYCYYYVYLECLKDFRDPLIVVVTTILQKTTVLKTSTPSFMAKEEFKIFF